MPSTRVPKRKVTVPDVAPVTLAVSDARREVTDPYAWDDALRTGAVTVTEAGAGGTGRDTTATVTGVEALGR